MYWFIFLLTRYVSQSVNSCHNNLPIQAWFSFSFQKYLCRTFIFWYIIQFGVVIWHWGQWVGRKGVDYIQHMKSNIPTCNSRVDLLGRQSWYKSYEISTKSLKEKELITRIRIYGGRILVKILNKLRSSVAITRALTGELRCVLCEIFLENLPYHNGTALHLIYRDNARR